tara:strand:- start:4482 stop:5099 length:618 start_codon:yes stop_codon:yes gene_type:complete
MPRPYKGHLLTEEQKKLAGDNYRLALKFVGQLYSQRKIREWEVEEVKSYMYWQICTCAEKYDPEQLNEEGRKATFATMAFRGFKGAFQYYREYEQRWRGRYFLTDFLTTNDDGDRESFRELRDIRGEKKKVKINEIKSIFGIVDLSLMERQVIDLYFDQKFTFVEIGDMFGLSRETIRNHYKAVLEKAKTYIDENGLELKDFIHS